MDSKTPQANADCGARSSDDASPTPHSALRTPHSALWDDDLLADPHSQSDKASRVRRMFDDIAPTYERVNTLTSAGRDRAWRSETVRLAEVRPADRVLDVACGTGDMVEAFARAGVLRIVGLDFASQMLLRSVGRVPGRAGWIQGDALHLPFADETFDVTSCAFGVRNFQNLEAGLGEMYRVLRPGGRAMILEFSTPAQPVWRGIYQFYFAKILPKLATWISGDRNGAYDYLPNSVRTFVTPSQMVALLTKVGFASAQAGSRTCGIVHIVRADKAAAGAPA